MLEPWRARFSPANRLRARKSAAVRFAENVLGDPDKADDIESEDLDDWIERKGITLIDNPGERSLEMANSNWSKDDLLDRIDELESENSDSQDQLDAISDIVSGDAGDDQDDAASEGDADGDDLDNVSDYADVSTDTPGLSPQGDGDAG
jgi:hypothetical protein